MGQHAMSKGNADRGKPNRRLRGTIVGVLLLVSLTPLCLAVGGGWYLLDRLLGRASDELQRAVVSGHARNIDLFLAERLRALELLAGSRRRDELTEPAALAAALERLNRVYDGSFVDLGVIGGDGRHLGYCGPYDLAGRNYASTAWFREVAVRGRLVSDVFLGFRNVPHVIMAVRRQEDGSTWVLRATIDSGQLDGLVRTGMIGETGDAFVVNGEGLCQTAPREGRALDPAGVGSIERHEGVRRGRVATAGGPAVQATAWINDGRWMLVVRQAEREVTAPVRAALVPGLSLLAAAVALIVAATLISTVHLTGKIEKSNRQREALSRDLLRSARLASLGELAGGMAHEVNNPLAVISAEQTNLGDMIGDLGLPPETAAPLLEAVARCKRQVERCGRITARMLQFGRGAESRPELVDVGPRLAEALELLSRGARERGIALELEVEDGLPALRLDPNELQQVAVNLVNNAIQAVGENGEVTVSARRNGREALIAVRDTGGGIAPEHLERIFQPFFSTKPVGRGTGLGLSVCYGLVRGWGGTIDVESERGRGTVMTIRLPLPNDGRGAGDATGAGGEAHGQ